MGLPKKRKLSIATKRVSEDYGVHNWTKQFVDKNKQQLPRAVDINDLDKGFIDFIDNQVKPIIGANEVPLHVFSLQRWSEFSKTWGNSDKYSNIKIPFISLVRTEAPETGTNPADFKIPVRKNFPYAKIPVWDGVRKNAEIHTIPNPVGVDLKYSIHFFSFRQRELNEFNLIMSHLFASAQAYVNIKGHYFPMLLESVDDQSSYTDIDGKRYYSQKYEIKLQGYIMDSEEFEIKPAVSRVFVLTELDKKRRKPKINKIYTKLDNKIKTIDLVIQFLPNAYTEITFASEDTLRVISIESENAASYELKVNGENVTTPFVLRENDVIYLKINEIDKSDSSEIKLNGVLLDE